jgi:RNA polymerase sigma-70 factor (ECF subfamily)
MRPRRGALETRPALSHALVAAGWPPEPGLDEAARAFVARAHEDWPALRVDPADLLAHVAAAVPEGHRSTEALGKLSAGDLLLARACASHDPAALRAFEERFLSSVPSYLARLTPSSELVDEVRQSLRERLILGARGGRPKLLEYSGMGSLANWLRIAAVRLALRVARTRAQHSLESQPGELAQRLSTADPELRLIKENDWPRVREVLVDALRGLGPRDRELLSLHYLGSLSLEAMAAREGVSRSTIARWLADCRARVVERTRALLMERLALTASSSDELLRFVRSELEVSLRRVLGGEQRRA